MRPKIDAIKQREFKPALPELKRMLVDMATAQAEKAKAAQGSQGGFEAPEGRAATRLPRQLLRRRLALGGAAVGVAATLLIVLGGGGATVRTERADAADLGQLAAIAPHLQLAGPWQITSTEVSPTGGRIQFHSEEEHPPLLANEAEIQWHSASIEERGEQLETEGFTFAGPKRMNILRPYTFVTREFGHYDDWKPAQVYVSREDGQKSFQAAAGLWREGGRTLEYRAIVPSFWVLERLMERIELLSDEEWFVALQPGGGKWLAESAGGIVKKIEKVKVGETPDGHPIYQERGLLGAPEPGEKLDFKAPLPTIYREGDNIRVVTQQPPEGLEQP